MKMCYCFWRRSEAGVVLADDAWRRGAETFCATRTKFSKGSGCVGTVVRMRHRELCLALVNICRIFVLRKVVAEEPLN